MWKRLRKGQKSEFEDTDGESTQSRQKGQMKLIFLSDSDKEAIVEFVKQNAELYKTHTASRNLFVNTVKKWIETKSTRYGKLTHMKSGQAAVNSTERQTWMRDSLVFYEATSEGRKCLSVPHSSHHRPSAAIASVPGTS